MRTYNILIICITLIIISSCSRKNHYEKGFSVSPETATTEKKEINWIAQDSFSILTRPSSVLLTGYTDYRLTNSYTYT